MTYEEFVSAVHRAGLATTATRKVLYLLQHGRKQPLVRWGPYKADTILYEEIAEATEAWLQGDKEHCLEELAQCGAVILRMMEFVEKET